MITHCDLADQDFAAIGTDVVETDGSGVAFQQIGSRLTIRGNTIRLNDNTVRGVDAPGGFPDIIVEDNDFYSGGTATPDSAIYNAVWLLTNDCVIRRNRWNGKTYYGKNSSANVISVPDVIDEIHQTEATTTISSLRPFTHLTYHQKVAWVTIAHQDEPGATPFTGTLPTTITFSGGGGIVSNGNALF